VLGLSRRSRAGALGGILLTNKSGQEVRWDLQYDAQASQKGACGARHCDSTWQNLHLNEWPRTKNHATDEKPDVGKWRSA
jgi:hypothetical protein